MSDTKTKVQLEFLIKSSPKILYTTLSSPSGLSEWFCNDVDIKGDRYIFKWDESSETATLLSKRTNEYIRFQWEADEDTDYFFELRIVIDPITKEVALMITDFAEDGEEEEVRLLWENQVADLRGILGS